MSILDDINLALNGVERLVVLIEKVDPNAANNPIFQDLNKALAILKSLGL